MKELYEKVIAAFKGEDKDMQAAAARNWMAAGGENPFQDNTAAHDLYFQAAVNYRKWQGKTIDMRKSKARMVEAVGKIAALNLPNPYVEVVEEPAAEPVAEPVIEQPVAEKQNKKKPEEKHEENVEHVMGVVEKKGFFGRKE